MSFFQDATNKLLRQLLGENDGRFIWWNYLISRNTWFTSSISASQMAKIVNRLRFSGRLDSMRTMLLRLRFALSLTSSWLYLLLMRYSLRNSVIVCKRSLLCSDISFVFTGSFYINTLPNKLGVMEHTNSTLYVPYMGFIREIMTK